MAKKKHHFRHLPPTAVPVNTSDLQAGLRHLETNLEQFQAALAAYLEVDQSACRLASSGRTALFYLLRGLIAENPSRKQVIMPAYTCPAVARVVHRSRTCNPFSSIFPRRQWVLQRVS